MAKRVDCPFRASTSSRLPEETKAEFVSFVEQEAREILGDVSDRKYLACRVAAGTMPHFKHVFEELGITYGDRKVPTKVLKSIANKERRVAMAKNTTTPAESRKRKGGVRSKTVRKK